VWSISSDLPSKLYQVIIWTTALEFVDFYPDMQNE